MEKHKLTWEEIKTRPLIKYQKLNNHYFVYDDTDNYFFWWHEIPIKTPTPSNSDQEDFENNYKATIDFRSKVLLYKSQEDVPFFTPIKNFSDNSVTRVSHDYSDKRTWWQNSTQKTGQTLSNQGDDINYTFPDSDVIDKHYITNRDLISGYDWKIYKNDTEITTGFTIDHQNNKIVFDVANDPSDVITADYYVPTSSAYELTPDPGKYYLLDYVEVQVSEGSTLNDDFVFELVLNNPAVGGNDYIAGGTSFNTANDFINSSNNGYNFPKFGNLTTTTIILPWNYLTGYKIFPVGQSCDPTINEFNKLRVKLLNDNKVTNCEISTVTFYCYERKL